MHSAGLVRAVGNVRGKIAGGGPRKRGLGDGLLWTREGSGREEKWGREKKGSAKKGEVGTLLVSDS